MNAFGQQQAEMQLKRVSRELHELAHSDYSLEQIDLNLRDVASRAVDLGIKRMKWLKILTLWQLYPDAAPEPRVLDTVLRQETHQDTRMRSAIELPKRGATAG